MYNNKKKRYCTNLDFIVSRTVTLSIKETTNTENFKGNIKSYLMEKGLSKNNSVFLLLPVYMCYFAEVFYKTT